MWRLDKPISEARHVAFGYAYLNGAFAHMTQERRFDIYRHIHGCWKFAAAHPTKAGSLFSTILTRRRSDYMVQRWSHYDAGLKRLSLIQPSEQAPP